MFVKILTTDVINLIGNIIMCLTSYWLIIFSISQFVVTDNNTLRDQKKNVLISDKSSYLCFFRKQFRKYFIFQVKLSTLCSQLSFLKETKKKNEKIFTLQYINCRQFVFITEYDLITPYKSFHSLPLVEVGQYFVEVLWWNLGCFPLYQVKYVKYCCFFFTDSSLWIWETW